MSLSKILGKFKPNFDLVPLLLYGASIYLVVQQSVEIFHTYFYYQPKSIYNPYLYALYFLVPVLAFFAALSSSLIKLPKQKIKFMTFSYFCLAFSIFGMLTSLSNDYIWQTIFALKVKMDNVPEALLKNAIRALTFYIPLIATAFTSSLFSKLITDRVGRGFIMELSGFMYSRDIEPMGPLTCEITLCNDAKSGKPIITPESKRMEATLIQGATGTGKTSTLLLPMGALDLEKKYFFREMGKEMGFNALQKGYAYIDAPLSNEELNKNFTLSLLKPLKGKEELFEKELKDMIKFKDPVTGEILYRDLGLTAVEPDGEYVKKLREIAGYFGLETIIVDPMHEDSTGINPFIEHEPAKVASIISTVLKGMYESENAGGNMKKS